MKFLSSALSRLALDSSKNIPSDSCCCRSPELLFLSGSFSVTGIAVSQPPWVVFSLSRANGCSGARSFAWAGVVCPSIYVSFVVCSSSLMVCLRSMITGMYFLRGYGASGATGHGPVWNSWIRACPVVVLEECKFLACPGIRGKYPWVDFSGCDNPGFSCLPGDRSSLIFLTIFSIYYCPYIIRWLRFSIVFEGLINLLFLPD